MKQTRKALKLNTPKSEQRHVSAVETRMPYQKSHSNKAARNSNTHPAYIMKSEVVKYSSNPKKGEPYGQRTAIDIKNGHGFKIQQILNKSGKAIKTRKAALNMPTPVPVVVPRVVVVPRAASPGLLTMHRALFL
jgi:hypothetical protein